MTRSISRLEKLERKAYSTNSYYIKTTGGNVIYNGNDEVTVQVAPQSFLRKKVEDLNTGERVLFNVNETKTTLEDVEPYLSKSPLYDRALGFVYDKNSKGENIPRFRIALFNSLARHGVVSSDNLEAKIMMEEGQDFTTEEYTRGSEYVSASLLTSPISDIDPYIPQNQAVELWLRGITLAPRDHDVFKILQKEMGEEFRAFISNPEDMNGFYRNYRIYTVIRQNIMKTLNSWKGLSKGERPDNIERDSRINITREIDLIRSHFLKDITHTLKSVMVTEIEKIPDNRRYDLRRTDRLFGEGVIRREIPEVTNNMINYPQVCEDRALLEHYLDIIIANSPTLDNFGFLKNWSYGNVLKIFLFRDFSELRDTYVRVNLALVKRQIKEWSDVAFERMIDDLYSNLTNSIYDTSLDEYYKITPGSIQCLVESLFRLRRTIPDELFLSLMNPVNLEKIHMPVPNRKTVFKRYNLNNARFGYFITESIKDLVFDFKKHYDNMSEIERLEFSIKLNSPQLKNHDRIKTMSYLLVLSSDNPIKPKAFFREFIENKGVPLKKLIEPYHVFFRTKSYTQKVLSRYGLAHIVNLCEEDFLLEDLGIPFPKPPEN